MTSCQQRPGGKFVAVDRRGNKHENHRWFPSMSFRARGFEREILGGNRGLASIGLKLF